MTVDGCWEAAFADDEENAEATAFSVVELLFEGRFAASLPPPPLPLPAASTMADDGTFAVLIENEDSGIMITVT